MSHRLAPLALRTVAWLALTSPALAQTDPLPSWNEDDKTGKPVAISRVIGKRPVIAVGNSDSNRQMLEWSAAGPGPRLDWPKIFPPQ